MIDKEPLPQDYDFNNVGKSISTQFTMDLRKEADRLSADISTLLRQAACEIERLNGIIKGKK